MLAAASTTCEACGWAAAFCSMLAFGSFGVPIKSGVATACDIDPLVMQTYKTAMCFMTSWLVLAAGEEFHFTPWGIISGLFWVPGGVATIYAVKSAGLAIGIGIGSSFIVLVSFVWGIFVFNEEIHSRAGASLAIFLMMLGLLGMSYYSSPVVIDMVIHDHHHDGSTSGRDGIFSTPSSVAAYQEVGESRSEDGDDDEEDGGGGRGILGLSSPASSIGNSSGGLHPHSKLTLTDRTSKTTFSDSARSVGDEGQRVAVVAVEADEISLHAHGSEASIQSSHVVMCGGVVITKRHWGMLAAAFCGIWGGSIMAPMKYAPDDAKGVGYLISFAIGASIVTLSLWLFRFLYYCRKYNSASAAYRNLPSFHFRVMWLAGGTCGLLWSIGNFFSLYSVYYLGEGVGYPLVQTSILISGLWGIFYFKEVQGRSLITKWWLSSLSTIVGIILLSYEHHEKSSDDKQ